MPEKTVLLVEDDRDSRDIYGTILRHAGYRVLEASDGAACIQLARQHRPNIIVMDLGLPQVDGWEATRTLRRDVETKAIPVIAVTVHVQEVHRGRATEAGCDGFLNKPCTPSQLLDVISAVLDREA